MSKRDILTNKGLGRNTSPSYTPLEELVYLVEDISSKQKQKKRLKMANTKVKVDTNKVNRLLGIIASKDSSYSDKIDAQSSLNSVPMFVNDKVDEKVKKCIQLGATKLLENGFVKKLESSHKDLVLDLVEMLDKSCLPRVNEVFSLLNMVKGESRGSADTPEIKDLRSDFINSFLPKHLEKGNVVLCEEREEARKNNSNLSIKFLVVDLFGNDREITLNLSKVDRNKK